MKLKFKVQQYQTDAVEAVVNCFNGQAFNSGVNFRIDQGNVKQFAMIDEIGFKNADLTISENQLLENINKVQKNQNLPISKKIFTDSDAKVNLDIEMETGTGKTYCYIKTIFELNKIYGFSKFIIMVPSIAIREGVYKSLQITADHFKENYGKKIRSFIYNSKQLHNVESFSSDAGINVMVINIQAFNASGKDNRRINVELDEFQSRKPIDVISANRPIIIIDEPQKMEGDATNEALKKFKPLAILRYSATHKTSKNKIYRLDALDAYNQKLVKKIAVRGISTIRLTGSNAYLYLESIEISREEIFAKISIEIKQKNAEIKRKTFKLDKGTNLFDKSGGLDQYKGFIISEIDYNSDSVEFTNGVILKSGQATGDITESTIRQIQIRETIKAHFEKEQKLFAMGIKVLSLFFIDEVAKYRDYSQENDDRGEYAKIFEEEYQILKEEFLSQLDLSNDGYRQYLAKIDSAKTHEGYFAIDKKTKKLKNPEDNKNEGSNDVDAYDLILKNKEKLLAFDEPVRFIFSHSALREGWDNPNVFVICMLKHSDNNISRRQEVGRGLRLCVNQNGDRIDDENIVHEINVLSVVASESYQDFVKNLQKEISETLSERPQKANEEYFTGKIIKTQNGDLQIGSDMAKKIHRYLIKNDYIDNQDKITDKYHQAKADEALEPLPEDLVIHQQPIFDLIDNIFNEKKLPKPNNDRAPKNLLNANFYKKEFKELWDRINKKAIYKVEFDSKELIENCIKTLNAELRIAKLQYKVESGIQDNQISDSQLKLGESFVANNIRTEFHNSKLISSVQYDLLGKLSEHVNLTRSTLAQILTGIEKVIFDQFKINPEQFIQETSRLINEQKASVIIECLSYDEIDEKYDVDIFTKEQSINDFSRASAKLKNHIYDYALTDSKNEKKFAENLDLSSEVVVYAKLPRNFLIPTPVGNYNPDWAISFKEGSMKYIYFVAETKGSMSSMALSPLEKKKIDCARKFFEKISKNNVRYEVVKDYKTLTEIIR